MRYSIPAALIGVLLLAGCASTGSNGAGATTTPTSPVSASPTPVVTPSATPSTTATTDPSTSPEPTVPATPVATPLENATVACTQWQTSLGQDASTFPATQAKAAQLAQTAATADPQWQPLASDMTSLVALVGQTSDSAIAQGQQLFTDLGTQCTTAGVTVSAG